MEGGNGGVATGKGRTSGRSRECEVSILRSDGDGKHALVIWESE